MGSLAAHAVPAGPTSVARVDAAAWVWRLRHAVVCGLLVAVALNSDPGKQVADTKLDLVVHPLELLRRALHLWDPMGSAGQLQDQAYGYLFPMGPFFALAHVLEVPGWVTQRLWWGLILSVGYVGFVVLARRLDIGSEWTRLVTGVGFAVAPHVLSNLGRASVEVWPPALAAWVLVPLVGAAGQERPRRAAALSGLAVLCMGGVNATVDLAALLPAMLWFLTRRWSSAWLRLALWWTAAVVAATLWWVMPLLALGRYSPPFLDFIESASITTSTTTLVEILRGTADWVAYLGDNASRAGYALLTHPLLILFTVLLGALGLGGLAWRRTNERVWLVLMAAVGLVLVALGHIGPVDGFFAADLRAALDAGLAPLRNVHKFDILVRLALGLGAASALAGLSRGRTEAETRFLRPLVAVAGVFVVVGASAPFFGMRVANPGSFTAVPDYWAQASDWLREHDGSGRTLLVPGSRFPQYLWGHTGDEPMQALADAPWEIRNAVPLTGPGHIRWLDAVERQLADGHGGAELAGELRTAGVQYLLARNDLDYGPAGSTRPVVVRAALSTTPGVSLVASFGPPTGGGSTPDRFVDGGLSIGVPALEVYQVGGPPPPAARLAPASSLSAVVGSAEATSLPGVDDLPTSVIAPGGTKAPAAGGLRVLTDTPRRHEVNFGLGTKGVSQTLAPDDPLRISKPTRDYGWSDSPGAEAVARLSGAESVTASSSASDADAYPASDPAAMPYAAFDASDRTVWRPNPLRAAQGSWLAVDLGREVSLAGGRVRLDEGTGVTGVAVQTDDGTVVLPVRDDEVDLPSVTTSRLRLSITSVDGGPSRQRAAGVRAVSIPQVTVSRTIVLPHSPWSSGPDRVVLSSDSGQGSCIFIGQRPLCSAGTARTGEDAGGLDRTFHLPSDIVGSVALSARPVPTAELSDALEKALKLKVHPVASSVSMPDLAAGPLSAVDGDLGTPWVASAVDPDPSLTLSWRGRRAISSIQVIADPYAAMTRPTRVRITSDAGERTVDLDCAGVASFAPLRVKKLTVHLAAPSLASSLDAYTVEPSLLGLGVSELRIEGLTPAITVDRASLGTPIAFPCGEGPDLRVDGRRMSTSVTTTVGDVLRSVPVAAEPCSGDDDAVEVTMAAGDVRVRAGSPDRWDVASVVITRDGAATLDGSSLSQPLIRSWQETHRAVALAARSGSSVLVVNENANRGWRATMAGRALDSVTIDGWQQGFVVPAGSAGVVRLDFTPDGPVRAGMAAGGLLAIGIVLLALIPERRRAREVLPPGRLGRVAVVAVSVACVGLVAGWWGFAVVAGVGVLGVAGRHWLPDAVFARTCVAGTVLCSLGAGMVLLAGPYGSTTYAADHPAAQLLCVAAVAMLILSLWRPEGVQRVARREKTEVEPGVPAGSAVVRGNGS